MRSNPARFRLPTALKDAATARYKEAGYDSMSEYALGLLRYDLLTRKGHDTTANLSKLSQSEQDKIDDEIARVFTSGENMGGSWFAHLVEEAVKAAGAAPDPKKLAAELLKRLKDKPGTA